MNKFEGIPAGRLEFTPLPNLLLTELLPQIDDLAEMQVTLRVYALLYRKKGSPRFVTLQELRADRVLYHALTRDGQPFETNLARGLGKAEGRGTLLHCTSKGEDWYFFNTAESRRAVEQIAAGKLLPEQEVHPVLPPVAEPLNIFQLYEQHIGVLTQTIAEELKVAQQEYPPDIILDAFRIANEQDKRTWSYVRKILLNWAREGKHEATGRNSKKRKPHFQGKFAEIDKRSK